MANKNLISVEALVYLKYDKESFKIGDKFNVRAEDAQEMVNNHYVELLGEVQAVQSEGE